MGLLTKPVFNSLEGLLFDKIRHLYDAEHRLTEALPKMADAAWSENLKGAFRSHLQQTEGHVKRLEQIFKTLGVDPERETCDAIKGIVSEGSEVISAKGNHAVKDAALIAAAQGVEHFEMASYGSAVEFAEQLGLTDIARILQSTLDEEAEASEILTELGTVRVNQEALRASAGSNA